MNERPDNYEKIQLTWSRCKTKAIEQHARGAVGKCINTLKSTGIALDNAGPVLCIGPQHGFELEEFRDKWGVDVIGIDCCPEFVSDCKEKGFVVHLIDAEGLLRETQLFPDRKYNIYSSHSIEHFWNQSLAFDGIKRICKQWVYFEYPEESDKSKDLAHFSQVRDMQNIKSMMAPFVLSQEWAGERSGRSKRGVGQLFTRT